MATRRSNAQPHTDTGVQQPAFVPPPGRQPLAARMRPRTLDEVVGHEQLIGARGTLRRALDSGRLGSLLLWGPPGSGKTSVARVLADAAGARLVTISAVMSGVAEVRALVAEARERLALNGHQTLLFIDEIHRFNKAQQDALLPHVEDGTVTLVGATTENPYFEVNSALLSRLRVFRLEPLTDEQVGEVVSHDDFQVEPRGPVAVVHQVEVLVLAHPLEVRRPVRVSRRLGLARLDDPVLGALDLGRLVGPQLNNEVVARFSGSC